MTAALSEIALIFKREIGLRPTHRFPSATLLGVLAIETLLTGGCAHQTGKLGPVEMIDYREVAMSPDGYWLDVRDSGTGDLDGRRRFLLSTDGRRQIVIPYTDLTEPQTQFSDSGNRAVWLSGSVGEGFTVWHIDLKHPDPIAVETTITTRSYPQIVVSPKGDRVAIFEKGTLTVYKLEPKKLVMTARLDSRTSLGAYSFRKRDRLRIVHPIWDDPPLPGTRGSYLVGELKLIQGEQFEISASIPRPVAGTSTFDHQLQFMVAGSIRPMKRQLVYEVASGRIVSNVKGLYRGFLPDGRLWSISDGEDGGLWVILEQPGTGDSTTYSIGNPGEGATIGMAANGGLVIASEPVSIGAPIRIKKLWTSIEMMDLNTGERRHIGKLLWPYGFSTWRFGGRMGHGLGWTGSNLGYPPSVAPNLLFKDYDGSLLGWDPVAEELVPIVRHLGLP